MRIILLAFLAVASVQIVSADALFQLNRDYQVKWGTSQFPNGYVDMKGQIVPPPTATGQPPVKTGAFRTGVFGFAASTTVSGQYDPFRAVCIDANEGVFTSGSVLYYVQSLSSFPTFGPYTDGPTPLLTPIQKRRLQQLYTVAWQQVSGSADSIDSSAFQWAVWEIARENTGGAFNVATGNVKMTSAIAGTSTFNAVRNRANQFLSWIDPVNTQQTALAVWSPVKKLPDGSYQRVVGQELLTLSPVPEPGLYALISSVVLVGVIYRRRRRASAAQA